MGVQASFTVVPGDEFKKHKTDLANYKVPKDCDTFAVDKAWYEFQHVFQKLPKPLSLVIQGDHVAYGRFPVQAVPGKKDAEDYDEDDYEDEEETYLAYSSPALVKKIDKALADFSGEDLLAGIKTAGFGCKSNDRKYYLSQFATLKEAYRKAAAEGAALQIFID